MSSETLSLPAPDPDETGPYALIGTVRAKPGQAEALERRLVSLAVQTTLENSVLVHHIHRDRADRNRFVFYEVWSNLEAFKAHLSQPHILAFLDESSAYLQGDLEVTWLRMFSRYPT